MYISLPSLKFISQTNFINFHYIRCIKFTMKFRLEWISSPYVCSVASCVGISVCMLTDWLTDLSSTNGPRSVCVQTSTWADKCTYSVNIGDYTSSRKAEGNLKLTSYHQVVKFYFHSPTTPGIVVFRRRGNSRGLSFIQQDAAHDNLFLTETTSVQTALALVSSDNLWPAPSSSSPIYVPHAILLVHDGIHASPTTGQFSISSSPLSIILSSVLRFYPSVCFPSC